MVNGSVAIEVVGVGFAILSAIIAVAYRYGKLEQESEDHASSVGENSELLSEVYENVEGLNERTEQVVKGVRVIGTEVQANRHDLRRIDSIVHEEMVPDGETCGDESCPVCHTAQSHRAGVPEPLTTGDESTSGFIFGNFRPSTADTDSHGDDTQSSTDGGPEPDPPGATK